MNYLGGDKYEFYLSDGKSIILSKEDFLDIAEYKDSLWDKEPSIYYVLNNLQKYKIEKSKAKILKEFNESINEEIDEVVNDYNDTRDKIINLELRLSKELKDLKGKLKKTKINPLQERLFVSITEFRKVIEKDDF